MGAHLLQYVQMCKYISTSLNDAYAHLHDKYISLSDKHISTISTSLNV